MRCGLARRRSDSRAKVSPATAAGVTDRLWEMVDVIDVLDAFEAKRRRGAKPLFEDR